MKCFRTRKSRERIFSSSFIYSEWRGNNWIIRLRKRIGRNFPLSSDRSSILMKSWKFTIPSWKLELHEVYRINNHTSLWVKNPKYKIYKKKLEKHVSQTIVSFFFFLSKFWESTKAIAIPVNLKRKGKRRNFFWKLIPQRFKTNSPRWPMIGRKKSVGS